MNLIPGIKRIYSISGKGVGTIQLDIDKNEDLDILRFEILSKIRQLYYQFPEGVSYPKVLVKNTEEEDTDGPLLVYSLSGQDSPVELFKYASEFLAPRLGMVEGLQSVEVLGGNLMEWRIIYHTEKMRLLGIELADLQRTIDNLFQTENLGVTHNNKHSFYTNLKNSTWNESSERLSWKDIPIAQAKGRPILLGDIATIQLAESVPQQYYRINGKNSIRLIIKSEKNTNHINLAKTIKANIKEIDTTLPATYVLFLDDDPTKYLKEELEKIIFRSGLSLTILLLFVLLVYRNWRHLVVIVCSLLANLGLAFIIYYLWKIEMHLYALAGITVSFGIMIDNSIVMVHHLRNQNNFKIFPALLAATLTTISALFVIWFLPEIWKVNLMSFVKVIIVNLSVSLLVALWLIPALLDKLFISKTKKEKFNYSFIKKKKTIVHFTSFYEKILIMLLRFKKIMILFVILLFGLPIFFLPNEIEGWENYNQTLGGEYYLEKIKPSVDKWLGGTFRLFSLYVYDRANYRQPEETMLYIKGNMSSENSAAQMNAVYQKIEKYLHQYSAEIKQYTTDISSGQYAAISLSFNKNISAGFPNQLKNKLIRFCTDIGGVEWNIYGVGKGFTNGMNNKTTNYYLEMLGFNKEELSKQAQRFSDKLVKNQRVKKINTEAHVAWWEKDLYQYEMQLNKQLIGEQGINPEKLGTAIKVFDQNTLPDLYTPKRTAIRFIDQNLSENNLWVLKNQPLQVDSQFVILSKFATLEKRKTAAAIHKENQQYIRKIEFEYIGSSRFGRKFLNQCLKEIRQEMPLGYSIEESEFNWRPEKLKQNGLMFLVIIFTFFICAIMFESLRQAFEVVVLIPTSFIGIFLTFYLFNFSFDQGGYTAFILLSGIVVNSIIFIINDYNYFRKKFKNRSNLKNYIKAFQHKISPILLTILSTTLGLTPFIIYGQNEVFWFSLAVGTIGGLFFSLLVILFFIPLFMVRK